MMIDLVDIYPKLVKTNNLKAFDVLLFTTGCIALIWFLEILWRRRKFYTDNLPGPFSLPLIGSPWYFIGSSSRIFNNICMLFKKYPPLFKVWLGPRMFYAVADPKKIQIILTKTAVKEQLYSQFEIFLGKGLFTIDAKGWKRNRKLIALTFNQHILDSFVDIFCEQGEVFVKCLEKKAGTGEFDVFDFASRCTLDIICETAMGVKVNAQTTKAPYSEWADRLMELLLKKVFCLWYQYDWIFFRLPVGREARAIVDKMHEFSGKIVREKKKAFEEKNRMLKEFPEAYIEDTMKRKAFLDYLLEQAAGENAILNEQQIRYEVDTFIITGTDTTASTISSLFIAIGLHQDLQEKVYNEVMDVLGADRNPTPEDLTKLKYTERFIKETLRLFPVGGISGRAIEEDLDLGDCIAPAGTSFIIGILRVHTDEKYWPNPYKFDPDRFLPEEVAKRHPCAYIPFLYGPRNCIGLKYSMMVLKCLLAMTIREYKIYTNYKNVKDIKFKIHVVLRPQNGYKVFIEKRN